ncbi:MAG: hypothetical protein ACI4KH_02460 [Oscillospiraceae bacterium]
MANTLKELEPLKVDIVFGGERMYLRYNLNARRYLEEFLDYNSLMDKAPEEWSTEEIIHLLRAGLIDYFYDENEKALENRDFKDLKPSMAFVGRHLTEESLIALTSQILEAIIESMPVSSGGGENFIQAAE